MAVFVGGMWRQYWFILCCLVEPFSRFWQGLPTCFFWRRYAAYLAMMKSGQGPLLWQEEEGTSPVETRLSPPATRKRRKSTN